MAPAGDPDGSTLPKFQGFIFSRYTWSLATGNWCCLSRMMGFEARSWSKQGVRTLMLVYLASIMEKADEALLPGVYKEIGETLHTSLAALGSLTLLRSITQALCFPFAAHFSVHYDRSNVIAVGAFLWSIATFFVGISSTFFQIAVSRGLNGVGLALVIPAIQSTIADASDESQRGKAFGLLQFTMCLGTILGSFFFVFLAGTSFLGIPGWRLSFFLVAAISLTIAILLVFFAVDPVAKTRNGGVWSGLDETFSEAKLVMNIKTFQFLVAQGIVGTIPGSTFAFVPLWLELKGFSHLQTASLLAIFMTSVSFGGLFGGFMGDIAANHFPNAGRIILAQISSGSGLPLAGILLLFLPYSSSQSSMVLHALSFISLGLFNTWNAPATNNPIFAEIVPDKSRTAIYALDRCFESLLASFAAPLVGLLAEKLYGFVPPQTSSKHMEENQGNALSLGRALYTVFAIPLTICCLTYSLLYWSYPRDRDRIRFSQQARADIDIEIEIAKTQGSKIKFLLARDEEQEEEEAARMKNNDEAQRRLVSK